MKMLGNKETMAKNLKKYMELYNVSASDICDALGIKKNTFSDWVNAKSYPRIDKIEMLADFFNTSKASLVEDSQEEKRYEIRLSSDNEPLLVEIIKHSKDFDEIKMVKLLEYAKMLKNYKEV